MPVDVRWGENDMRTILRVGIIAGVGAFVLLFALQFAVALVVTLGILVAGGLAGMGAAKWLEWTWYGRQLEAGWKTGILVCGLASLGALLSLLVLGPHSTVELARASHLGGLDLGPLAGGLGFLGWVGTDILVVLVCGVLGVGLSALAALLFALGKSNRTVDAITQARHAAQAANRTEPLGAPLPSYPFTGMPSSGTGWHSTPLPGLAAPPSTHPSTTHAPASHMPAASGGQMPPLSVSEMGVPVPNGVPAPNSGRSPSTARPMERELREDERQALAEWAGDETEETTAPRVPKPSSYLNSSEPAPTPKRGRKKQNTRDWLC